MQILKTLKWIKCLKKAKASTVTAECYLLGLFFFPIHYHPRWDYSDYLDCIFKLNLLYVANIGIT